MTAVSPLALMLAGGTGGHVYPALAVADDLRQRGFRLAWVGTANGLEARVVPDADITLHRLPMRGLRGKGLVQQLQALVLLGVSLLQALWLMLRIRPSVVIGMGGYASVPAAIAAWLTGRPLMLQEQNAIAGSANRALSRFARRIATGFPGVLRERGAQYLGNPVRKDLLNVAQESPWLWNGERPLQVLVLGGSLGARPLNEALPAVVQSLGERCHWWHQCGGAHETATRESYGACGQNVRIDGFLDDMAAAYAWADLVICRAGALTVSELAVTGRPSILIPLPHAIDDHQTANAAFLADADAGVLLPQDRLDELAASVVRFLDEPEVLIVMAAAAQRAGRPQATQHIGDAAVELIS